MVGCAIDRKILGIDVRVALVGSRGRQHPDTFLDEQNSKKDDVCWKDYLSWA